jgi:hypothetical protein
MENVTDTLMSWGGYITTWVCLAGAARYMRGRKGVGREEGHMQVGQGARRH